MIKLLKNASVHAPEKLGVVDILIAGEKIVRIAPHISGMDNLEDVEVLDLGGALTVPGLIDSHVHVTGGGGEIGPVSRVPEMQLSQFTMNGITTVLGLLGTDGISRSQEALISKTLALTAEGISCYCLAGAYRFPSPSLTGDIARDIALIGPVIGVKIALSDHRSSNLTLDEFIRLCSDARLGGVLSGKAGIVVAHMGGGEAGMKPIFDAIRNSNVPAGTIIPAHCERNERLTRQAAEYTRMGGIADFTADAESTSGGTAESIVRALEAGADADFITLSSDSGGSLPVFDQAGHCIGMGVGTPNGLLLELRRLVRDFGIPLETALCFLTANPAKTLGKTGVKGVLAKHADADILVLNDDFTVNTLFARGKLMVQEGKPVVFGLFECGIVKP